MKKIADIIVKGISYAGFALLTTFAAVLAIIALTAVVFTFVEGDLFNLIIAAIAGFLAWFNWSVRREVL